MIIFKNRVKKIFIKLSLALYLFFSLRAIFISNAEFPFVQYSMFGRKMTGPNYRGFYFYATDTNGQIVLLPRSQMTHLSQQGINHFFSIDKANVVNQGFEELASNILESRKDLQKVFLMKAKIRCRAFYEQDQVHDSLSFLDYFGTNKIIIEYGR
jgi:hypothetical protein